MSVKLTFPMHVPMENSLPNETELGRTGYIAGGPEAFFKLFEEWRGKFEKGKDQPKAP